MTSRTGRTWFAPRRYGYGAKPSTWEGWSATAAFVLAVAADMSLLHGPARWIGLGLLVVLFAALCRAKCSDELRWRCGE